MWAAFGFSPDLPLLHEPKLRHTPHVHNRWNRRRKRLQEKHRWYFEEAAARVVATGHATVELGVTSFDASLDRKGAIRRKLWLTIDGPYGQSGGHIEAVGEDLARVIADYMINHAANFPGVQIPTRPTRAE